MTLLIATSWIIHEPRDGWLFPALAGLLVFVLVKHVLENFDIFAGEITVHLRNLKSIKLKVKYFSPDGATKANIFVYSSILVVYQLTELLVGVVEGQ